MPHFFAAALWRITRSVHVTCLVARKVQKEALLVVSGISQGMKAVFFGGKTTLPKCAVFLFLCALFILPSLPTHAAITPLINYQGKLLTSSSVPVASGTYQIEFTLYDASSGGNVLWTASGTTGSPDPISVPVQSNGLFSILLGDIDNGQNTLEGVNWNTSSLYLGITVGSDSEMTPRKRLSSTPQAFNAEAWNGYKTATSINAGQGGEVLKLSQTANDSASILRTVLQLTTSGTSALLDSFLRLTDETLGDVFTINRQGHTTTTGNLAALGNTFLGDSNADTLIISSRIASDLIPTLSDTFSLGSDSLRWNAFLGIASTTYLSANTLNVTSTLTYLNAEGTNTTTTHLSVTTLASLPENTTINGQSPCLTDGTNCDTPTLQEVTNAGSFTTTSLTLFGGLTTSDLTATGTTSLQDFTFSHGTGTSLTLNGLFTVSSALSSLQALTFTNATGSALNLTGAFTFTNATGTSLFLSTLLTASDILSTNSITINGTNVCLENGTNCEVAPTATNFWTYDATDDFLRPNTNTTDLVLGAGSIATSPFYFQASATSSRLYLGAFNATGTNVVLGATTSTITNTAFQLDGNDLFVAGNIGSASSVYTNGAFIAGSGTTLFGDGFVTRTGGNLTVSSSQHVLFLPSSNVGIGTSTPSEKLTVVGGVQNLFGTNTSTESGGFVETDELATGAGAWGIAVQGRYAYVTNNASGTLSVIDVSDSSAIVETDALVMTGELHNVAVQGRYAYVTNFDAGTLSAIDVSNPSNIVETDEVATGDQPYGIAVQGRYAYVVGLSVLSVVDVSDPANIVKTDDLETGDEPIGIAVQGRYAYVTNNTAGTLSVVDVSNPSNIVEADEVATGAGASSVAVQGRYAYVTNQTAGTLSIIDVSNPSSDNLVETDEVAIGVGASGVAIQGRYAYVTNQTAGTLFVVDVLDSSNAVVVAEVATGAGAVGVVIQGRYAYVTNETAGTLSVVRIPGIETTAIEAHSAEIGSLGVRGSAVINNGVTVGGGLNVGQGGIYSAGALAVSATNTTSTFLAAVSSTVGTFTTQVTVGGQLVCLADGTNCQAGGGGDAFFTYNAADDFIRPNTSTTDFILGANSIATAPFYFQTQTTSSRLYLGAFNATGTNVVLGATTSTITNTLFQLDGNDLFVAGNIGSASSVYTNGAFIAGTTLYGDGFINAPSGNLVVSSSAHVAFMPSSNVGIGTSTPSEKLTVVGNIFQEGQAFAQEIGSLALDAGAQSLAVQDRFAYVGTASTGDDFHVIDLSVSATPVRTSAVNLGAITVSDMEVRTPYAYLATGVGARIINISNPSAAATGTLLSLSGITGLDVQGRYAYLGVNAASGPHLRAVDLADPTALVNVGSGLSGSLVVNDVAAVGQYAYLATSLASSQFYVMNIADPQFPATGTAITLPAVANSVKVQGRYAYVGTAGTGNDFHVIDISDPASPSVVGAIDLGAGSIREISVQGRYAYLATENSGAQFRIVDISNPAVPVPSTALSLSDTANGVWVQGRYAYVATNGTGNDFHVIALKGLETTALEAHSAEVGSLGVRGNAVITNNVDVAGGLSVGSGANFNDEVSIYGSTTSTLGALYVSQECPGSVQAEKIASFAVRGDTKISIRCNGQLAADNGISGAGGDYAEYFISSDSSLEGGDVVAFDPQYATTVTKGMAALRNYTLGVVSTKPVVTGMGHLEHHPSSTRVGLLGQLDTKVSTRAEEIEVATGQLPSVDADLMIRVGDFLMAGDNGIVVKAHGPGIVLGRALEDFPAHATGTVRAFISPSYWAGGSFVAGENGETLLVSDLTVAAAEDEDVYSPSPLFSLQGQGRVLGAVTSTSYTHTYSFQTNVTSATSSFFTLFGEVLGAGDVSSSSTRTSLLRLSHEGDLFLSGKLYPGERMVNTDGSFVWNTQTHASIFFNDTLQSLHTNTGFSSEQDGFATRFKTKDSLEAGDLVIFDPLNPGYVKKSESYGTGAIAGVVSEYAGFVAGVETGEMGTEVDAIVTVIVTGRSTVFVSTQNGEILPGDPLTPSDIPGVAMKATEPGAFLGIALESWGEVSVGEVGVAVQGGWFAGSLEASEIPAFGAAAAFGPSFTGLVQIEMGDASAHVTFPSALASPMVFATPSAAPGTWWIANQSDTGFDIILAAPLAYDITFSWTAEPTPDGAVMWHSNGTFSTGTVMQSSSTGTSP